MLATLPGVELSEAGSVAEASDLIRRTDFDLMLLDVRLTADTRDRGGLEFLKMVRAWGSSPPAVMVTSSSEMTQVREAMRSGAQDYVLKDELSAEMLLPVVLGFRE